MAYTFVQVVHGTTPGGGNPSATYAATGAGNLLVAFAGGSVVGGSPVTAISMPAGWVDCGDGFQTAASGGQSANGQVFYYPNNPGGITAVTATFTNNGNTSGWLHLFEFGNAPATVIIEVHSTAGSFTNPSITTTKAHELVFIALCSQHTVNYGADTGWTQDVFLGGGYGSDILGEYQLDASAGTYASTVQSGSFLGVGFAVGFQLTASTTLSRSASATFALANTFTRVGASTFALRGTTKRSASGVMALFSRFTRSASSTFSIKGTFSRKSTAKIALGLIHTRSAAATIQLDSRKRRGAARLALSQPGLKRKCVAVLACYVTIRRAQARIALRGTFSRHCQAIFAILPRTEKHCQATISLWSPKSNEQVPEHTVSLNKIRTAINTAKSFVSDVLLGQSDGDA